MELDKIKLTDITPAGYNPRLISEEDYNHLKKSIEHFGLVDPIIINLKNNRIIGGHQRYDVLLDEYNLNGGYEELDLLKLGDIGLVFLDADLSVESDDHEKALNLALNKISGEWDLPKLEVVLDDLEANNFDLDITGFDVDDLTSIDDELGLDDLEPDSIYDVEEDDYDEEPEELETDITQGDLFRLGDHYLLCGDATSGDDVATLLAGGGQSKIDMVFTDPPYNCSIGTIKHPKFKIRPIENDDMSTDDFKVFCEKWINNIKSYVTGCCYICAGQGEDGRVMFTICDELLHNSTTIIWNKDTFTLGRGKYQNKYEPIWFGWNESGKTFTEERNLCNVFDIDRPKKSELHPTMKPLELIGTCLTHNPHAETVLDLFGGSGSTLIACEQLNRNCYMMELDPKYCQTIINRWEEYTGKEAEKINN